MIRILVGNGKGGVGKSTVATGLAAALAARRRVTALADADRQRSSLGWLERRPANATPIRALDWTRKTGAVPAGVERLVVDAPANLDGSEIEELLDEADRVVVPVQPSLFDQAGTERFLGKLGKQKSVRKGRKEVVLVLNRLRPRARATARLEAYAMSLELPVAARLADRAIYEELAAQGLAVFDLGGARTAPARAEWAQLVDLLDRNA
ncbi:nucleotide-binding protein [Geminicoccus flavidas]|uniref:nucleotide-binding protein n=1 Tax=Geminicoccus flavidas TaxID=2506407 RepID=UPI00135CD1D9|nr:division plane positioning ATPase MipZ [Geminicoccus flavidas]